MFSINYFKSEKAINTTTSVENSTSDDNSTIHLSEDIFGKAFNTAINVKNKIIQIGTPVKNKIIEIGTPIKNKIIEIGTPIVDNIHNSTSSQIPFVPDHIVDSLPTWAWIVVGITLALVICCCCCCPQALGQILGFPFYCAFKIISLIFQSIFSLFRSIFACFIKLPLHCLSCLGFDKIGVRAASFASGFQSMFYKGNTPSGTYFSDFQSYSMK
ncbi:unnamed protein product [Nezara viridula]|uniref:Uncharacterized protein n=1 Tax=Nezara viridula TaxID=85310 RepID=A0A9P0HFR1_NEZVI|nr:unnamed protein product [Nezara viridula]